MGFAKFVVVTCLLSTVSLGAAALNVIVGQDIDFQCHTEDGYAPEFQRQADDSSWTTLYTGDAPRPGTDRDRWYVTKDMASVFHYRLLNATLNDGGHYRCNSVSTVHHPLRVVSTRLECGELPLDAFVDSTFRPVCRVATSGPESGHAESTQMPFLKWVVGNEAEGKNLTTTHSASAGASSEATLTADLTDEFHGKDLSCILDVPTMEENPPKCTLGPLNISFPVKSKRLDETRIEDCHSFEMLFFANPAPVTSLLSLEDPSGRVEFSVDTLDEGIAANLRACGLQSDVEAVLSYDGEAVELLTFLKPDSSPTTAATSTVGDDVATVEAGSSTEAVVAAIVVILLLAAGGGAFAFYVLRMRKDGRGVVGDEEAGVTGGEKGEKETEEEKEPKEDQDEEEKKADMEGEKEAEAVPEKVAIDVDDEVAKDVVESEAELKSKLSVLEDVEGVKMIDDSINEGKEDEEEKQQIRSDEKVDV